MSPHLNIGLVWLRRDLRCEDNAALDLARQQCKQVHCVFLFDRAILEPLPRTDRRVAFIRTALVEVDAHLRALASHADAGLIVLHGEATGELPALAQTLHADAVFCARDYEPAALARDRAVAQALHAMGRAFITTKDHVIYETREVLTQAGTPFTVFTPYWRAWLTRLTNEPPSQPASRLPVATLAPRPTPYIRPVPTLQEIGFTSCSTNPPAPLAGGTSAAQALLRDFVPRLAQYQQTRDFPSIKGPSYLSVHLRFGTISIRTLVRLALHEQAHGNAGALTWLQELAWRDFYFQILSNFPHVADNAFRSAYDAIEWDTGPQADQRFSAWAEGRTGYPLVDAAMLQLRESGYMHNRLRMVSASFLVKHLGLDWRRGERFFATHLNDFDLAANNGGWQWVSSSGCDAQPYFRIFNPVRQSEKFDSAGAFIRRYLPALRALSDKHIHAPWLAKPQVLHDAAVVLGRDYPLPIVDQTQARHRTLQRYAVVRQRPPLGPLQASSADACDSPDDRGDTTQ